MRDEGLRRLTPGYLENITDTKTKVVVINGPNDTNRFTILTPTARKKLRLIRYTIWGTATAVAGVLELYFGTAADAEAATTVIDLLTTPGSAGASSATRTWARGHGPGGVKDGVLSGRFRTAPGGVNFIHVIEYTEED